MSHRAHKHVTLDACHYGHPSSFTQHSHDTIHLSYLIIHFSSLRPPNLTPLQQIAFSKYQIDPIFHLGSELTEAPSDYTVLTAYHQLFDTLFFFSTLSARCNLILSERSSRRRDGSTAVSRPLLRLFRSRSRPYVARFNITLYSGVDKFPEREKRLLEYLGTLLHEMGHAFLSLWGCNNWDCKTIVERQGMGHGWAWQDVAFAVEGACRDVRFLGLRLDLGRVQHLAKECLDSGVEVPWYRVGEWGMEAEEVRREMEEHEGEGGC